MFNNQSATFDNMYALPRLRLMTMKTVLMFCSPFSKSILNLCNRIIKTLVGKICPSIIFIGLFNISIKCKDLLWFTVKWFVPRSNMWYIWTDNNYSLNSDDFHSGCQNVSQHYQQQSFSGLHSTRQSDYTITCTDFLPFLCGNKSLVNSVTCG